MSGIVETLQNQRVILVDVVRQIDTALAAFGATNGHTNGNGHTPVAKTKGSGSWWATKTPAQRARITRKILAAKRRNRQAREASQSVETL